MAGPPSAMPIIYGQFLNLYWANQLTYTCAYWANTMNIITGNLDLCTKKHSQIIPEPLGSNLRSSENRI